MKSYLIFIIVIVAFGLSFSKHISFLMYPLSGAIFYFYLPVLYASSRINILHHIKEKEVFHIKFYPMELGLWLISTCFFSYVLSHLLSELLYPYRESLYHFSFLLIIMGLAGIVYCELDAIKFHLTSKKKSFTAQGKLLSFEIFFVMLLIFELSHSE
jgi:hypothetical protein